MPRPSPKLLALAAALAALLTAIHMVQGRINALRRSARLVDTDIVANAPPVIAFTTVALGAFRGLLADALWLRSISLQDRGQYFEMVQLASWITKLQPRFTGATAHLAWNMAYNVSVTFTEPEDRWRWVQRGLELIRDEALEYNPGDALLYRELGWIYQHKIGNVLDDANYYYKNQLALAMTRAFGGPEPPWDELIAAPTTLAGLRRLYPPQDPLWTALGAAGFADFTALERQFRAEAALPAALRERLPGRDLRPLELALRSRWLRQTYKLSPRKMRDLDRRYGQLDWRLPEAHAIYWASLGIDHDRSGEIKLECERMISQALKEAFIAGRLVQAKPDDSSYMLLAPNFAVLEAAKRSYLEAWERHRTRTFLDGLESFAGGAVVALYTYGQYDAARRLLDEMRRRFPDHGQWRPGLDEFVTARWRVDIQNASPQQAMYLIDGLIYRSCFLLAAGDRETAVAHERMAARAYREYFRSQGEVWSRTGLPPFATMKQRRTELCLQNFPPALAAALRAQLTALQGEAEARSDEPPSPTPAPPAPR